MVCTGRKISYDLKRDFSLGRVKDILAKEKKVCFCVCVCGGGGGGTLGMDCGHDPTGGQSYLYTILAQFHCRLVDRMFCNCSQVSQYINIFVFCVSKEQNFHLIPSLFHLFLHYFLSFLHLGV